MAARGKKGAAASGTPMILLDSNIIIYSALEEFSSLRDFIRSYSPYVSAISRIEVLGFPALRDKDSDYFQSFFDATVALPISEEIVSGAVALRRLRKMKLGDSIIGATALVHNLTLASRNTKDFIWIDSLRLIDPFDIG